MAKGGNGKGNVDNEPVNGGDGDDEVAALDGTNKLNGGDGADTINGGDGYDFVNAGDGDDVVSGGGGDDLLHGNDGFDTAVYSGSVFDYTFEAGKGNSTIVSGADGTDTIKHFEELKFDDYSYYIDGRNNSPFTRADEGTTDEDSSVTIAVLDNDMDIEGDPMTVTSVVGAVSGASATTDGTTVTYDAGTAWQHLAVGEQATDEVTYTVEDGNGGSRTETVTVTITGSNDAPVVSTSATAAVTEDDAPFSVDLLAGASDVDGTDVLNAINVTLASGDASGVTVNGNSLSVDPNAYNHLAVGESETVTYNYDVSDGNGGVVSTSQSVKITGVNDDPTVGAAISAVATEDDAGFSVDLLAGAADVDTSDTLNVANLAVVSGDASGITVNGNSLSVNPSAYNGLAVGESAVVSYSYDVSDGNGGTAAQTATITINGVNDAPDANDDAASLLANSSTHIEALDNDTDPDGDALVISAVDAQSALGVSVNNHHGDEIHYDPSGMASFAALAGGEVVQDTVSYTISDGNGGTDTATATFTVTGVNDGPVANNDSGSTDEDTAITVNVLANDSDVDNGDSVSVASADTASTLGASVSVNNDGTINYDPTGSGTLQGLSTGQSAVDTFSYVATDNSGATSTATVSITVAGANDGGAVDDTASADEDTTAFINVLGNDVGSGMTIVGLNGGGVVSESSDLGANLTVQFGQIVYSPQGSAALQALGAGDSGVDTFTYTMQDSSGTQSTATVTVNVAGREEPTNTDSGVVNEVMGFDNLTGNPGSYTEDFMTVTSLFNGGAHIHDSGDDIRNHSGCCSTPYEFTYNNAGDTSFSMHSFQNVSGSGQWTNSNGGNVFISAGGTANLDSSFENVEWVRWHEASGSNYIDNVVFSA